VKPTLKDLKNDTSFNESVIISKNVTNPQTNIGVKSLKNTVQFTYLTEKLENKNDLRFDTFASIKPKEMLKFETGKLNIYLINREYRK